MDKSIVRFALNGQKAKFRPARNA